MHTLDTLIERSHHIRILGRPYHPYLIMADLGLIAVLLLALIIGYIAELPPFRFATVIGAVVAGYPLYLSLKERFLGIRCRVFLQDMLLFVFPTFIATGRLADVPIRPLADFWGLAFPLILSFGRIGCFLGGCCYGIPSRHGVLYPPIVWANKPKRRRFTPDIDPAARVFPMQLVEAVFNSALFGALIVRVTSTGFDGRTLPIYLIAYCAFRFLSEFFRGEPSRRYFGPLSEAQWTALLFLVGSLLALKTIPFAQ